MIIPREAVIRPVSSRGTCLGIRFTLSKGVLRTIVNKEAIELSRNDLTLEIFSIFYTSTEQNPLLKIKNLDLLKSNKLNHFIEIDQDSYGSKYLVIHTGSRNLGKQVADYYTKKAIQQANEKIKLNRQEIIDQLKAEGRQNEISQVLSTFKAPSVDTDFCYLEGKDREEYLHDMKICQRFAVANREIIARNICTAMNWTSMLTFESVHNYIDEDNMVRKGAIAAKNCNLVIIPMNMRDGCILGVGRGNEDWNYSAPHGAGRLMSRSQARKKLDMETYTECMEGIYTTSVTKETIDEAPQAYKPMEEILSVIEETVDIIDIIKPVYNFKASE